MTPVPDYPDAEVLVAPLYVVLMVAEVLAIRLAGARGEYEARDTITSLLMGIWSVVTGGVIVGLFAVLLMQVWEYRLFDLGHGPVALITCFVAYDLIYYWQHRLGHRSRWFWARHVIHHSSQHFNLSTALRQPWATPVDLLIAMTAPLVLLGFHPALVAFCVSLDLIYQFWIHTEAIDRMPPWFEAIFNTPSHHRVHHGRNPRYLDVNYAGTFIVWDRLFGTFEPERRDEPVRYGLVKNLGTFNPIRVAYHEILAILVDLFRPGLTPGQRLKYVFAPPGWSHDGSRTTSDALKQDFFARVGHDLPVREPASLGPVPAEPR